MNSKGLLIGIILILAGGTVFALYDRFVRPEREALAILKESRLIIERGDRESYNLAINTLRKVLVSYPDTKVAPEAYYMTGQAYEKLGLYRLASLKYSYLLKAPLSGKASKRIKDDTLVSMNRIRILRNYTNEGVHNLYTMLGNSQNPDLRSRVYSELGQAYLRNGDTKQARTSFDIALQENSANEEAIIGKARSLKKAGLDDEAFTTYEYFLRYYGMVSPYANDVKSTYMNELYASSIGAFKSANYSRSITLFSKFLGRFGDTKLSENALYWTGESYFAQHRFDNAVTYFDRVLSNGYYHKDEDARIKKGYAYFISKRFDIAAREFQTYLKNYPNGKHASDAKRWKEMSTQEIRLKVENYKAPEIEPEEAVQETRKEQAAPAKEQVAPKQPEAAPESKTPDEPTTSPKKENPYENEEVSGNSEIELDNIAEM